MTKKTNCASKPSIEDLRDHVAQSLGPASGVLINLIDVLAIGPRLGSPVEMTLSPMWGYRWSSLYTGISRASRELAETIADDDWLQELRKERLAWLASQEIIPVDPVVKCELLSGRRSAALWISSRRDSKSGGEERLNSKGKCELNRRPIHSC